LWRFEHGDAKLLVICTALNEIKRNGIADLSGISQPLFGSRYQKSADRSERDIPCYL